MPVFRVEETYLATSTDSQPIPDSDGALLFERDTQVWYQRIAGAWVPVNRKGYVSVTGATATLGADETLIGVNRAGVVTLTLPSAQAARVGRPYVVKDESGNASTNNITVATEGAETIDGAATDTVSTDYGSIGYYSNGTNWFKV